eukprot:CAMPEP_0180177320 /NCGR_PEP_ID=MMETSP0986-20121125/37775_1 /TAXON_ID=697907 /ORGANISM="non described non described, Strain CCMP2293" /LENGTH=161 /DNA_ID=CAMNT_0022130025 /DNA_START=326 /DNA_END=811 /DNA_ORIENTATION=+
MQRHVLALALFALIAAPAVHAGCCTDKCKGKHSTAASCKGSPAGEFPRKDAGCAADNQEGDCSCDWSYQGAQTTANGCVDLDDSSSSELWDCTGAPDYETKGECQDPIEILGEVLGAVAAGIGGVLVRTPPHTPAKRLLAVLYVFSRGRHSDQRQTPLLAS